MTDDEEKFWEDTVAGIRKISSNLVVSHKIKSHTAKKEESIPFVSHSGFTDNLQLSDFHNVDASTAKKIKRNSFKIEAKLDLHGYTLDQAYTAVRNFVFSCYNGGKRCIIIVTGKGVHKDNDNIFSTGGVLRDSVPVWLNDADIRPLILSVNNPAEKLGGTGALYIILRRKRQ